MAKSVGAYSIVYHAGFYLQQEKEKVFEKIYQGTSEIMQTLKNEGNDIWIRPETTGKASQWGDLDEIIEMSTKFENMLPCIDFAHIHARYGGKFNTYEEFCTIFEKIDEKLGARALNNFHAHIAGIAYSDKGERHHLVLEESDFNYKDLLKAFKKYNTKGVIVCESPSIEADCKILKDYYESL
jgi:deoxyribonuclease-4